MINVWFYFWKKDFHFLEVKRSPSKEVSERKNFPAWYLGAANSFLTSFMGFQGIGSQETSREYKEVIRSMESDWVQRKSMIKTYLLATDLKSGRLLLGGKTDSSQRSRTRSLTFRINISPMLNFTMEARWLLTFLPPVLMRRGVRKGSKIIWLVSMLTGDCRFPTEQRFQAEFTNPQKEGTRNRKKNKKYN